MERFRVEYEVKVYIEYRRPNANTIADIAEETVEKQDIDDMLLEYAIDIRVDRRQRAGAL